MDYIPSNRPAANQAYYLSAILAHNLNRELQMSVSEPTRVTTEQRLPQWSFLFRFETLRNSMRTAGTRVCSAPCQAAIEDP
jgi:hypothetical protein